MENRICYVKPIQLEQSCYCSFSKNEELYGGMLALIPPNTVIIPDDFFKLRIKKNSNPNPQTPYFILGGHFINPNSFKLNNDNFYLTPIDQASNLIQNSNKEPVKDIEQFKILSFQPVSSDNKIHWGTWNIQKTDVNQKQSIFYKSSSLLILENKKIIKNILQEFLDLCICHLIAPIKIKNYSIFEDNPWKSFLPKDIYDKEKNKRSFYSKSYIYNAIINKALVRFKITLSHCITSNHYLLTSFYPIDNWKIKESANSPFKIICTRLPSINI
ncbi:hypothetical protein ACFLYH_00520 [Candidatus Dependentiae bacterium]